MYDDKTFEEKMEEVRKHDPYVWSRDLRVLGSYVFKIIGFIIIAYIIIFKVIVPILSAPSTSGYLMTQTWKITMNKVRRWQEKDQFIKPKIRPVQNEYLRF